MPLWTVGCGSSCGDGSGEGFLAGLGDGDTSAVGCPLPPVRELFAVEFGSAAGLHPAKKQNTVVRINNLITRFSLHVEIYLRAIFNAEPAEGFTVDAET